MSVVLLTIPASDYLSWLSKSKITLNEWDEDRAKVIHMRENKAAKRPSPDYDDVSTPATSFSCSEVRPRPNHLPQSVPCLCTIINPSTTGNHHKLCWNMTLADLSPPSFQNLHVLCTNIAFGARLVIANHQVVSPDSGTKTEQMPVRRIACRSATAAFFLGSSTESMR